MFWRSVTRFFHYFKLRILYCGHKRSPCADRSESLRTSANRIVAFRFFASFLQNKFLRSFKTGRSIFSTAIGRLRDRAASLRGGPFTFRRPSGCKSYGILRAFCPCNFKRNTKRFLSVFCADAAPAREEDFFVDKEMKKTRSSFCVFMTAQIQIAAEKFVNQSLNLSTEIQRFGY